MPGPTAESASSAARPKPTIPGTFSVDGPQTGLLLPAVNQGLDLDALLDVESAHALGRVELVSREAQEIDIEGLCVQL